MENVARALFECPVCFEIPEGEVYQCKNEHSICDPCSDRVELCPQCRLPLGKDDKIRNRTMEAFIGGMEVGCTYEEQGCEVRMPRKDLAAHLAGHCGFRPKFSLCKPLGFTSCDFVSFSPEELFNHFVEEHERPQRGISLSNTDRVFRSNMTSSLGYMRNSKENRIVTVNITMDWSPLKLILCSHTNISKGDHSVFCLYFGSASSSSVPVCDVTLEIEAVDKDFRLSWSGKPTHYTETEDVLINPPFKISIPYLLKVLGDSNNLKCIVSFY